MAVINVKAVVMSLSATTHLLLLINRNQIYLQNYVDFILLAKFYGHDMPSSLHSFNRGSFADQPNLNERTIHVNSMDTDAMASNNEIIRLVDLIEGMCERHVVVKVDRMIHKEVVRYPLGFTRPMKELVAIQLVVFDDSLTRNVAVMDDVPVIERLAPIFVEDRCYKICNFLVRSFGEGPQMKLYLKLLGTTHVEHTDGDFPRHCFDLRPVSHVLSGVSNAWGLVDVCGILKTLVETGMGQTGGVYCTEVVLLLEDNGVLSVGHDRYLSCTLYGHCAETTVRAYEAVEPNDNVLVVIQYAMVTGTSHDGPTLTSFHNATRVYFNPTYPEVHQQRINMLHRILPDPNSSSLPII